MPSLEDVTFARVSDYFLAELRKGTAQPIEQYANAFPHLADEIREFFPTMARLENGAPSERPAHDQEPGGQEPAGEEHTIGSCVIDGELGRGAMGVVYSAHQPKLDRRVAIKVMAFNRNGSEDAVDRFERECRTMAQLDHPNIVPVYEYGAEESQSYFVMKLIEGRSLDKLIADNSDYRAQALLFELQSDWKRFAWIAAQVASALNHAHSHGVVHRDIKPANLLIDEAGKPWVTDFGIAKLWNQNHTATGSGMLVGTPNYMAPEQFHGLCDARADIYSLGLTLHCLAAGKASARKFDPESDKPSVNAEWLPPISEVNPEVPDGVAKIIDKACSQNPEDRYQSACELEEVLSRYAEGYTQADRRSSRRPSDEAYRKRLRRLTWLVAVVVLFAVAGAAHSAYKVYFPSEKQSAATQGQGAVKASAFLEKISNPDAEISKSVIETFVEQFNQEPPAPTESIIPGATPMPIVGAPANPAGTDESNPSGGPAKTERHYSSVRAGLTEDVRSGRLDDLRVSDLVKAYRETSLPAASRLMNRTSVIYRSGLSDVEKQVAMRVLHLYSTAIVNRHIPEEEANITIDILTGGAAVSAKEIDTIVIPDRKLRSWLGILQNRVKTLPRSIESERPRVEDELRDVIDKALEEYEQGGGKR